MSQENVEVVRRFYDAYNRRAVDELATLVNPDFAFRSVFVAVEGRVYRGADGFSPYFADLAAAWEEFWLEVQDIRDAGDDRVLGLMQVHGRGGTSGVEVDPNIAAVFQLRDGRVSGLSTFMDPAEALEAAGLRE
jgi:ketosteroid isomerase-like protein